jgi:hypothetical protein
MLDLGSIQNKMRNKRRSNKTTLRPIFRRQAVMSEKSLLNPVNIDQESLGSKPS